MKSLLVIALSLAAAPALLAQVAAELSLEQEQYLRDESLPVKVRIENRSGQVLTLGRDVDWLTFHLTRADGSAVDRVSAVPVADDFTLENNEAASRLIDVMPHFDLGKPGRYEVTATVRIKEWGVEVHSKPVRFEITRGAKFWELDFGVPDSGEPPEARKYALLQTMYFKRLQLYLRITDLTENRVFKVVSLGPMVTFARPETQMDKSCRLHVLFQTGARLFIYQVINPDGTVAVRQLHDYTTSKPRLDPKQDGTIVVSGGARRNMPSDIPPPTNTTPTVLRLGTNHPPAVLFTPTNAPLSGGATRAESKPAQPREQTGR